MEKCHFKHNKCIEVIQLGEVGKRWGTILADRPAGSNELRCVDGFLPVFSGNPDSYIDWQVRRGIFAFIDLDVVYLDTT